MTEPQWQVTEQKDGVVLVDLQTWKDFYELVNSTGLENIRAWIWRGQRQARWPIESTLDRLKRTAQGPRSRDAHLAAFKSATRGRRGANPPRNMEENDWWALGQHYGLATPLLDWSLSPYVGAFFAFAKESSEDESRGVFGLEERMVRKKCEEIAAEHNKNAKKSNRPDIIEFIRPDSDENPRLITQSGLFTRLPDGDHLEAWVRRHFAGVRDAVLVKMSIPNSVRIAALKDLNRMNINYASLFPDLEGAGLFSNMRYQIKAY